MRRELCPPAQAFESLSSGPKQDHGHDPKPGVLAFLPMKGHCAPSLGHHRSGRKRRNARRLRLENHLQSSSARALSPTGGAIRLPRRRKSVQGQTWRSRTFLVTILDDPAIGARIPPSTAPSHSPPALSLQRSRVACPGRLGHTPRSFLSLQVLQMPGSFHGCLTPCAQVMPGAKIDREIAFPMRRPPSSTSFCLRRWEDFTDRRSLFGLPRRLASVPVQTGRSRTFLAMMLDKCHAGTALPAPV